MSSVKFASKLIYMEIVGYIASLLIGISLGLIGGGGSILTVPVMVYLFGSDRGCPDCERFAPGDKQKHYLFLSWFFFNSRTSKYADAKGGRKYFIDTN